MKAIKFIIKNSGDVNSKHFWWTAIVMIFITVCFTLLIMNVYDNAENNDIIIEQEKRITEIEEELKTKDNDIILIEEKITEIKDQLNNEIVIDLNEILSEQQETDSRIKMLSSEVTQTRIEIHGISHRNCEVLINELWEELEHIRKMVK